MEAREAGELVRAFSLYFQVVNLAEKIHRIRLNRDLQLAGGQLQWRGLVALSTDEAVSIAMEISA